MSRCLSHRLSGFLASHSVDELIEWMCRHLVVHSLLGEFDFGLCSIRVRLNRHGDKWAVVMDGHTLSLHPSLREAIEAIKAIESDPQPSSEKKTRKFCGTRRLDIPKTLETEKQEHHG